MATAGALLGTLAGARVLRRVPDTLFRGIVALPLAGLGLWMLTGGAGR